MGNPFIMLCEIQGQVLVVGEKERRVRSWMTSPKTEPASPPIAVSFTLSSNYQLEKTPL